MPFLTAGERLVLEAALARLIPADEQPGAVEAGVVDYVDGLLSAFDVDPPRIWAGGPFSGRAGGHPSFARWVPLPPLDAFAWRTRIGEWQRAYRDGLAALGDDFADIDPAGQDARLTAREPFTQLMYEHACEGMYGAPEYGGNRDLVGWHNVGFDGDVQPRGYTDDEVSLP